MIHLCRSGAGRRPSSTSHYASAAAGAIARYLEEFVATETIQLAASHMWVWVSIWSKNLNE